MLTALAALLAAIALLVGVACVVSFVRAVRLRWVGLRATGRVVAHETDDEGGWFNIFEYVVDGTAYRVTGRAGGRLHHKPIGEVVRIVYDPTRPARAELDTLSSVFVAPIALGIAFIIVGGMALALGLALGWTARAHAGTQAPRRGLPRP